MFVFMCVCVYATYIPMDFITCLKILFSHHSDNDVSKRQFITISDFNRFWKRLRTNSNNFGKRLKNLVHF